MEILVITWNYPPRRGGIENLVSNLFSGLRTKHSIYVVTSHAPTQNSTEGDTFRAPLPGLLPFALYALWRGALVLFRHSEIRVIFGGSAMMTPLVLILARMFGRRAVIQTHGLDVIYQSFLYQPLCVRWMKYCDRVIANSTYTAELSESKGVTRNRVLVIPPGVYPERFSAPTDVAATKQAWRVERKKIILFVGRLAKRKGVKEFIENSFVQIVREVPEVCFIIIGNNPAESLAHREDTVSEIKAVISRSRLENHVRLLGSLGDDEVIKLYQACDLVVLPALNVNDDVEGFGIVALEAAAAGKPVVAMRVGGIPDAVQDGQSGVLVRSGDYAELTQAIVKLLRDDQKRVEMGKVSISQAKGRFAWEKIVAMYEQALS